MNMRYESGKSLFSKYRYSAKYVHPQPQSAQNDTISSFNRWLSVSGWAGTTQQLLVKVNIGR